MGRDDGERLLAFLDALGDRFNSDQITHLAAAYIRATMHTHAEDAARTQKINDGLEKWAALLDSELQHAHETEQS